MTTFAIVCFLFNNVTGSKSFENNSPTVKNTSDTKSHTQ